MRSHLEWGDFGQWESTKEHKGDLDSEGKLKVRIVVRTANLWRYQAVDLRPVGLCTDSKQASGMNAYRSLGVPVRTSADQPVGRCAQRKGYAPEVDSVTTAVTTNPHPRSLLLVRVASSEHLLATGLRPGRLATSLSQFHADDEPSGKP